MATSPLPSSPVSTRRFGSRPTTPTNNFNASRKAQHGDDSPSMVGGFEGSPTSTFSSSATTNTSVHADAPHSSFRNMLGSATAANPSPATLQPQRQLYVRADPALLTCFDPLDKELYDLWAPKRSGGRQPSASRMFGGSI